MIDGRWDAMVDGKLVRTLHDTVTKPPDPGRCGICGKQMRHASDKPFGLDCGGDCWECVKDSEGTN